MSLRIALLIIALLPALAFSLPSPPPGLLGIFQQLEILEESLEERAWDEAESQVDRTSSEFARLRPHLQQQGEQTEAVSRSLNRLKEAVAGKSFENSHGFYLDLQQQLITIMDHYDYKIHPVLFLVDSFIEEAREGYREGDLEEVVNEMREIEALFGGRARALLEQRGAAPAVTERFAGKVRDIRLAAAKADMVNTAKGLSELQTLYTMLAGTFGSR